MRVESLEKREMLAADFAVDFNAAAIPSELVVQFEPLTTIPMMHLIAAQNGGEIVQLYRQFDAAQIRLTAAEGASGDGGSGNSNSGGLPLDIPVTPAVINQWIALDQVKAAEPNYIREIQQVTPDDEFFAIQWGHNNDGFFGPSGVGIADADIDAIEAWEITTGQTVSPEGVNEVVIAIIDSGVDFNNPDLTANAWHNPREIPDNQIDDDGNGLVDDYFGYDFADLDSDPTDTQGHGTHVAGTVGAVGNNQLFVTGVNWNTKIMALRAGDAGLSSAALLGSYNYIVEQKLLGVNIVASNNSYGGSPASGIDRFAISATIDAGILFVAASGNDAANNDVTQFFPSGYDLDGILAVGASDSAEQVAIFSSNGAVSVDIHAPGVDILSTRPPQLGFVDFLDGTSMASPHAAGVAGLLGDLAPGASPIDIKAWIMAGTDVKPVFAGLSVTGGRLNAMGAINAMPKGVIQGVVFDDVNNNGVQDANESGVGGIKITLDRNFDGVEQETGEASVFTAADGSYSITNYWHTDFQLAIDVPAPIPPIVIPSPFGTPPPIFVPDPGRGNDGNIDIPLKRGKAGGITGTVYNDQNGNGRREAQTLTTQSEPGLGGVYVFADLNGDDRLQLNEPVVITNEDGGFDFAPAFDLPAATYTLRVIVPPGWSMTAPASFENVFTTGLSSAPIAGLDFGLTGGDSYDFGDEGAATTLAADGARHGVLTGFHLGADVDREVDAVATDAFDDGVTFTSTVFAGGTVTADVEVSLGGFRPGYLNAWVDANGDGTFAPTEQVIANVRLLDGTHAVSFVMPASAVSGPVATRFRYGWEFNMGPMGAAMAGEVEDYILVIAGDTPVANSDQVSVDENSLSNSIPVLVNDFASSSGGLFIQATDTTATSGTVTISGDQQTIIYTPRTSFSGVDTFVYTIEDASGLQASASVAVTVTPTFADPVAIDDQEIVPLNSPGTVINLLGNDLSGSNGPLRISTTGLASNGSVSIDNRGTSDPTDDFAIYVPNQNYQGIDQFSYTVADTLGVTSSAVVTVFVGNSTSDDTVQYFIEFTTLDGVTPLPNNQIGLGGEFLVNIYVQDVRLVTTLLPEADHGVFAAYLDVLYPAGSVSLSGGLIFNGDFPSLPEGDLLTPGIIDEAGAFQDLGASPPGSAKQLLFRAPFTANAFGVVTFVPNISDEVFSPGPPQVSGDHDTLFWEPTGPALPDQISYLTNTITIVSNGEPAQNPNNAADVNNDGRVGTSDLAAEAGALASKHRGNGENTAQGGPQPGYFDVNGDGVITPLDLLLVINELNQGAVGNGESSSDILSLRPASGEAVDFSSLQTRTTSTSSLPVDQSSATPDNQSSPTFNGSSDSEDDAAFSEYLKDSMEVEGDDDFFAEILANWE